MSTRKDDYIASVLPEKINGGTDSSNPFGFRRRKKTVLDKRNQFRVTARNKPAVWRKTAA